MKETKIGYFKQALILIVLALTIRGVWATTQTINTLPSANATFMADIQTFLGNEIANYMNIRFVNEVAIGGLSPTDASLTATITAIVAFPEGFYTAQAATSHTYTATKRTFVYVRDDDDRVIAIGGAVITYDDNLVFAEMVAAVELPDTPTGTLPLFYADTDGSSITAVTDLRSGRVLATYFDDFEDAVDNVGANQTIYVTEVKWTGTKTATQRVEIAPGARLLVEDGATLTLSNGLTVNWGSSTSPPLDGYDGGETLTVNGELDLPIGQQIFGSYLTVNGTPKIDAVYPEWWGTDVDALNAAITLANGMGGAEVRLRSDYQVTVGTAETIDMKGNVHLIGGQYSSVIYSTGIRTAPMVEIDGVSNILIKGMLFNSNGDTQSFGQIEIAGNTSNVRIENTYHSQGYSGVWIHPDTNDTISDIYITNGYFTGLSHNIYLGANTAITGDTIKNVFITDTYSGQSTNDGIKATQSVSNFVIKGCTLIDNTKDGFDGYASGDRFSLTNCIIKDNTINGVDLKTGDTTTDPIATWGNQNTNIIADNVIENNTLIGIRIATPSTFIDDEWVYGVTVADNLIISNGQEGVELEGVHYINVHHNFIAFNGTSNASNFSGIRIAGAVKVGQADNSYATNITIDTNHIVNNGNTGTTTAGIIVTGYVTQLSLLGNIVENDSVLSNNFQNYGIWFSSVTGLSDILVKNNHCNGHEATFDMRFASGTGALITGESISLDIGTVAAGDIERAFWRSTGNASVLAAYFINHVNIAQNDTDFETISLINHDIDGSGNDTIASVTTKVTGGVAVLAKTPKSLGTVSTANRILVKGTVIGAHKITGGAGKAVDGASFTVDYVTY